MGWWLSLNAKVILRGYDPFAKEVRPEAVDHHAGQQCGRRRTGLREPAGQRNTAAAGALEWGRRCCGRRIIRCAEYAEKSGRYLQAGGLFVAAQEQVSGRGRADVKNRLDLAPLLPARFRGADAGFQPGRGRFLRGQQRRGDVFGLDGKSVAELPGQVFLDLAAFCAAVRTAAAVSSRIGCGTAASRPAKSRSWHGFRTSPSWLFSACNSRSRAAFASFILASSAGETSGSPRSLFFVSVGITGSHFCGL